MPKRHREVREPVRAEVSKRMVAQSPPKSVVRGTGWQSPPKPEDRSRQFAMFDAMVDHMVGSANDTSKLR